MAASPPVFIPSLQCPGTGTSGPCTTRTVAGWFETPFHVALSRATVPGVVVQPARSVLRAQPSVPSASQADLPSVSSTWFVSNDQLTSLPWLDHCCTHQEYSLVVRFDGNLAYMRCPSTDTPFTLQKSW